jgi:hypothetical protein
MEKYIFIGLLTIAILILCVQIITEIIKSVIDDKKHYNLIVLGISIVLTIIAVIVLCQVVFEIALTWYYIAGAVVLSFFVAYGAMLGYDKLFNKVFNAIKQAVNSWKTVKDSDNNDT